MDRAQRLIAAGAHGLSILENDRRLKLDTPRKVALRNKIRRNASRSLRRAVWATLNDLDLSVLHDLAKILKKLNGTKGEPDLDRVSLAFKLTELTLEKKRPPTPDHILWVFRQIYRGLGGVDFGGMAGKLKGGIR